MIYLSTSFPLPLNDLPLVARSTATGVPVKWRTTEVVSGITPLRCVPWPVLTVVAEDGTTRDYRIEIRQPALDAFVANFPNPTPANEVWVNHGGRGRFSHSGQALGSSTSHDVALGEVDGDGDLDAFVASYDQPNLVWVNDGRGGFSDTGQTLGTSASLGLALGDVQYQ